MKEHEVKIKIGLVYLILAIIVFLMASISRAFLYMGFSVFGLSLRAFYFAYINLDKDINEGNKRKCYGSYYIYYPLMLLSLLGLVYLLFFDKYISSCIEGVFLDPIIAVICIYIGFDIYRIAGKNL